MYHWFCKQLFLRFHSPPDVIISSSMVDIDSREKDWDKQSSGVKTLDRFNENSVNQSSIKTLPTDHHYRPKTGPRSSMMVLYIDMLQRLILESQTPIPYVTLHGVSGNKVKARTRHVITRSHANGMTRLPCRYAHKNNWFWKACS